MYPNYLQMYDYIPYSQELYWPSYDEWNDYSGAYDERIFGGGFPPFSPPGQGPTGGLPPFGPPGQGPTGGQPPFGPPGQGPNVGPPTSAPPSFVPQQQATAFAVDPGGIRGCLFRFTYVWLRGFQQFWFYPTFVGRTSVAGYRWTGFRWIFTGVSLRQIQSFSCF